MSRVTVIDVLETGACIDGVLKFVADHAGRIECDSAEFPHEAHIQEAAGIDGYGDGDGDGYGDGDGDGYGDGYGYGYGNGNGDGDGDGYGYG